ncbi:hypothetical protein HMPREF0673_00999 [Leyella stercorea DSM 18206]|uniref:Uncharacterized protein n=1 Tax=Leyella stercorea DSM 18206 TaxID=1002367 RepID=G6AWK1_9BACT|nr:hypothetical protein HMPREF0673_00999 [Leyella stercorea DSM 18206]
MWSSRRRSCLTTEGTNRYVKSKNGLSRLIGFLRNEEKSV